MFIDLTKYDGPDDISADICIIGAGAAGITLALELAASSHDVCLLESGSFEYDVETQTLAQGSNTGLPYYDLMASRLRFLGGTTNHWAGICRPLDTLDFEKRDHVPDSGWPITREELDPYYEHAHVYCQLGRYNYDPGFWATDEAPLLPIDNDRLNTKIMLEQPVRFGSAYRDRLDKASNLRVFLAANATEIEATENGAAVSKVHARTLTGQSLRVSAGAVVLAAGAIENARLLMCSDRIHSDGLGNDHDLVGRYFMEHPLVPTMEMQLASADTNLSLYTGQDRNGLGVTGYLSFNAEVLQQEGMLNACASLNLGGAEQRIAKSLKGVSSAVAIWNSLKEGSLPPSFGSHVGQLLSDMNRVLIYSYERAFMRSPDSASLVVQLEQAPNPESRVTLTEESDALQMRKVALNWRMGDLERHTIIRFAELIGMEVGRAELGRIRVIGPNEDGWWDGMRGSWHQMGTTRMHTDSMRGVVDSNCRVHGIRNLYVAGSSVFTTSGFANPTLTIVALAIRLAEHLNGLDL